jgi:hypothetical protein
LLRKVSFWSDLSCGETVILLRNLIDPGLVILTIELQVLSASSWLCFYHVPNIYLLCKYVQKASFRAFTRSNMLWENISLRY